MRRIKGREAWRAAGSKLVDKVELDRRWRHFKLRSLDRLAALAEVPGLQRLAQAARPTIRISEQQLLARLSQYLPFRRQYLYIFDLLVDNPVLDIHAVNDRFTLGMDVHVHLSDAQARVFHGVLEISMGIDFDAQEGKVYLTDPRIWDIRIKGLPDALVRKVAGVANELLLKYLDRLPVYRLENDTRSQRALKRVLKDIRLGEGEIILELGV
jgi:hypothetical protein